MNPRRLLIALIIFGLLAALYTGFWFYHAKRVQAALEEVVINLSQTASTFDSHFYHTATRMGGFPFSFTIALEEPHFIEDQLETSMEISSQDPLILGTNILGSSFFIQMPPTLTMNKRVLDDSETTNAEAAKEGKHLSFTSAPRVVFKRSLMESLQALLRGKATITLRDILNSNHIHYFHDGMLLTDKGDSKPIISTSNVDLLLEGDLLQTVEPLLPSQLLIKANIERLILDSALLNRKDDKETLPLSIAFSTSIHSASPITEVSVDGQSNTSQGESVVDASPQVVRMMNIHSLALSSALFHVKLFGTLETSAKDLIPYGTLSLVLDRPEAFLTSLYQFFSGKPFAWTHTIPTEENIPAVLAFLSDISDNPHVDNTLTTTPLITFTLSREQRGDLMVGKYNYREALTLFNDVIAAHHKK